MVLKRLRAAARARPAGFAMVDVLVALVLLAFALAGACATLIQAMRATHGALLTMRAVDLAADLTEALRDVTLVTQAEALLPAWRERVRAALPVAGMTPGEYAALEPVARVEDGAAHPPTAIHEVVLRWIASADGARRELRIPVALANAAVSP
jgi:hypothetical protein